jgi:hypothetical protein
MGIKAKNSTRAKVCFQIIAGLFSYVLTGHEKRRMDEFLENKPRPAHHRFKIQQYVTKIEPSPRNSSSGFIHFCLDSPQQVQ